MADTAPRPTIAEILLRQLTQRSTLVALISAVALIVGWTVAPERLDAIAVVVSLVTTTALAVVQERQGPVVTTTTVSSPPAPPVTVTTTTDDSAPASTTAS